MMLSFVLDENFHLNVMFVHILYMVQKDLVDK